MYFKYILKREYADKNEQEVKDYVQKYGQEYVSLHYKLAEDGKTSLPTYPYSLFIVKTKRGPQSQLMFPCLSRHLITRKFINYLISYAFVENERFLYGFSSQGQLEIIGLIESPPHALSFGDMNIESYYLKESADTGDSLISSF